MKKEDIISIISDIRKEIGYEDLEPDIVDIIFNEKSRELLIVTSDRPEKSLVIGKGGWVVGKLKEKLEVDQIHVESYSDILTRKYRVGLSIARLKELIDSYDAETAWPLKNLEKLLVRRIENPYSLQDILGDFNENTPSDSHKAFVALSGGVDSSSSLVIAEKLGFNPVAVTVNPGNIILPKHLRDRVDDLTAKLGVEHRYLEADMTDIVEGALEGRYHPCGRCSKLIEETMLDYAEKEGVPFLIFGDFLATGAQSFTYKGDVLRINLPAMLSANKGETKSLSWKYGVTSVGGYGCPLLSEVQKKYNYMARFSMQRVLRETRAGVLEPGEALDMVMSLCRNQ